MKAAVHRTAVFALVLASVLFSSDRQIREKDLPDKYREWLELATYIILPKEKEVFLQLQNDRDRDLFIQSFWRQRDPTPETPQNEFKDEHTRRFHYANANLKRATPRPGWMTDMGRMHIILGPPSSIERFDNQAGIHPCQVWYYRGESRKGLPALFALVFYQRGGSGEYKLYNPAADGPASLLVRPEEHDVTDYAAVYTKIRELAPSLAPVVLSVVPGEFPFNFTPSPQNSIILANILESPRKDVSPRYATDFLSFKGLVSTEYLTNYVESSAVVAVLPDPVLGLNLLHLSISPQKVSVDYYEPKRQFYANFKLNVALKKGGEIIFQHENDFPLYFPPDRKSNIEVNGIAVEDVIPVAEGDYELSLLLQNSVGREFSYFERHIHVPAGGGAAQWAGPVLGYRLRAGDSGTVLPFKVLDRQISVDSGGTLSRQDELAVLFAVSDLPESLWRDAKAKIEIRMLGEGGPPTREIEVRISEQPYRRALSFGRSIPAAELAPDYYELGLAIVDGDGNILSEGKANFIVSATESVSHPVTLVRPTQAEQRPLFFYALAYQYDRLAKTDKAEAYYEKALAMTPGYARGIAEFAGFLVKAGKFDKALDVAEGLGNDDGFRFQYLLVKGLAVMGKENYEQAIPLLVEGNRIYDSDVRLLNALGNCYHRTGRKKEALDALNASLRLNPEQEDIKALVQRIRTELR